MLIFVQLCLALQHVHSQVGIALPSHELGRNSERYLTQPLHLDDRTLCTGI